MEASVKEVEKILDYKFKNKKLLEEALTHPSYGDSRSFRRLEYLGDGALGLALSTYSFHTYIDADQGELVLVRSANVSTETLARVAVRHGLDKYLRRNDDGINRKVTEFVGTVAKEVEREIYGGSIGAPKVLADIIETLAAAVYVDCDFNLKKMWESIERLLEPLITLQDVKESPNPVTQLNEWHHDGKKCETKFLEIQGKHVAIVTVGERVFTSAPSNTKENANLNAARLALQSLPKSEENLKRKRKKKKKPC